MVVEEQSDEDFYAAMVGGFALETVERLDE